MEIKIQEMKPIIQRAQTNPPIHMKYEIITLNEYVTRHVSKIDTLTNHWLAEQGNKLCPIK